MPNIKKTIENLTSKLSPRQKEVINGRFGLDNQEELTLAAIGSKHGLTRERIRQIENAGLNVIKREISGNTDCQNILTKGKKFIQANGGVATEKVLLADLGSIAEGLNRNHLNLLLEATNDFNFCGEDKDFWSFYYLDKEKLATANKFINQLAKHLKAKKEVVLAGNFNKILGEFTSSQDTKDSVAKSFLSISKKIHENPYRDTGLSEWPEIKPQNIRDRIYLVLKKAGEPLHFETITQKINEVRFDSKKALGPTVHNELIKDSRFVLVGRGIYGLTEHGYQPGTVQEVIHRILKTNGPLKAKDISLAIQKERIVKPNTILVNLQNRKHFERLENGAYRIREA